LTNADTANVSFIVPGVDADTVMVLEVQVTDNEGDTATSEFSVTITPTPTPANPFSDSALQFSSGTSRATAVFLDDILYLSKVGSGGDYSFAIFEDTHLSTFNNVVSDATGIGYNVVNYVETNSVTAEQANLGATLVIDSDNTVTSMLGYSVNLGAGGFSTTTSLVETTLRTDLNSYNGLWKDLVFNGLTIDTGLNLSATDEDGCNIAGMATNSGNNIFNFEVIYSGSGCEKSGNYDGVLTLADKKNHVELSWMAFDNANQGVFGSVDTKLGQDESLPQTFKLLPSVYLGESSALITILDRIYTVQFNVSGSTFNPSFFDYTYDAAPPASITGVGMGLYQDANAGDGIEEANSNLSFITSTEMENISATITYEDSIAVEKVITYTDLSYISSDFSLNSVTGTWGPVELAADGSWTGNVGGCDSTGVVTAGEENIFNVSVTLSACPESANNTNYSGVVVAFTGDVFSRSNNVLVAILSAEDGRRGFSGLINQ
jgi:hypothetical protein